ncbi:hydroquinone glucosyltransferase-like [Juglans microcarpa x Juglans regia]|uniref:hydroquinone glucosyltransferase-like n=1 Tax=Juglans microcarpa x Juglans regia TaxID=2249226 RepID=UPI001B7E035D|nr:hydroquinone glucosyltransferase-like [Juglans microcarpa x Juglans regia]
MEEESHIAILPSPGMGHLIPIVELAKRLALHHNFRVTCIIPTTGTPSNAIKGVLEAIPTSIDHVFLPPVSLEDVSGALPGIQVSLTMTRSLPSVRHVLKSLAETTRLVAVILDHSASDALNIAKELNVSPYIFFPSNALALSLLLHLPKLDKTVPCEYRDLPEPLKLSGCIPIHGRDLMDPIQDRKGEWYRLFLRLTEQLRLAEGIMVNTFMDLQETAIKALADEEAGNPPLYPIGPMIKTGQSTDQVEGWECLRWLDNQPCGSVLFVSFGSGGTLSSDQLEELASGLELSGQKFLWVARRPNNDLANAAYLSNQSHGDPLAFLPQGFVERTKVQGLVVSSWAPQVQVLSHRSTGGFLTHCGWNSTLESIVNGVPLIAWPLYSEQRMNAVLLVEDLKVALRPKTDEKGIVNREEIAKVIKGLMVGEEGKRVHNRMKELKIAAEKALSEDGSSIRALSEFTSKTGL